MKLQSNLNCHICNTASSGTFLHMFWECPVVISLWTHVNLFFSSLLRIDWSVNPSLCLLNDDSGLCISSMQKRMLFLFGRPQVVKVGQFTSNSITLNVGAPQGCVLSPLLYSLYTHDCVSSHRSTSIIKFADDTVVLGLISNNDETAYLDEVERLTPWCQDNCLSLNVNKTKELIVDFRKRHLLPYTPLMISGTPVERVSSFKYLGVNISEDLTWTTHRLHTFKHRLRKPGKGSTICDSWGNSGSHQQSWKLSIQGP